MVLLLLQRKLELIPHQDKSFAGESFSELKTSEKMNTAASLNIPKSSKRVKMKKKQ